MSRLYLGLNTHMRTHIHTISENKKPRIGESMDGYTCKSLKRGKGKWKLYNYIII